MRMLDLVYQGNVAPRGRNILFLPRVVPAEKPARMMRTVRAIRKYSVRVTTLLEGRLDFFCMLMV